MSAPATVVVGAETHLPDVSGDGEVDGFVAVTGGGGARHAVIAFGARREALRAARSLRSAVAGERGSGPVGEAG